MVSEMVRRLEPGLEVIWNLDVEVRGSSVPTRYQNMEGVGVPETSQRKVALLPAMTAVLLGEVVMATGTGGGKGGRECK